MITHRWFSSGEYSLLGHMHKPAGVARLGVVIVPPFGWEDVCSYRPLRELAEMLAGQGIAVLRYDLPGTGDSTGGTGDPGLIGAWIASVDAAANELRAATHVAGVAVLGIRMGALVALAAAASGAKVDDLILWGGAVLGRSLTRELRAFRNMEVPEFGEALQETGPQEAGIEAGGFYLTASTVAELESIDLMKLPTMPGRRVLVLTRDEFAADKKLLAALKAANVWLDELAGPGYASMMTVPHEAELNRNTAIAITGWLKQTALVSETPARQAPPPSAGEQVLLLPQPQGESFGIITPVAKASGTWLLFLNPGAGRHIGPNRLWVEMAREWSARGIPSLRLDLAGIGESDGAQSLSVENLYDEALVTQIEVAMKHLEQHHGAKQFALIGLCSGAFWGFHAAARSALVRSVILLNPRLFFWDPEVDRRREKMRNANAVGSSDAWKRLVRGQVSTDRLKSAVRDVLGRLASAETTPTELAQIPAQALNDALARISNQGTKLSLIFTEGEPLLRELEEEGFLEPDRAAYNLRCLRVNGAGHTFRPLHSQVKLRALIEAELAGIVPHLSC